MLTYSIAIRTLAKNPEVLKRELESIVHQTLQPEKVVIYIAESHERPSFVVGKEVYVAVDKGMVAQRALPYEEIDSDLILMLDDDVELAEDSAERMLRAMEEYEVDCVAADTFKNQEMTRKEKMIAFITNGVYGRSDDGWAFRQCRNGSFSFNEKPNNNFCKTETFAGPCWMVKRNVLKKIHLEHELWLDQLGFAYGDDAVESYKFFLNGYQSGVLYDSGVRNLDAKTSSGDYHHTIQMYYTRSFGMFVTWWRMIYLSRDPKGLSAISFVLKSLWQFNLHVLLGLIKLNLKIPYNYVKGLKDGWNYVHSETYKAIPPYVMDHKQT